MKVLIEFTEVYQDNERGVEDNPNERKISVDPRYVHFVRKLSDEDTPCKCVISMGTAIFLYVKESYAEVTERMKMF